MITRIAKDKVVHSLEERVGNTGNSKINANSRFL